MLSVYTRHYAPCKHTDIYHRRCRCPKWIQGTLDDGRIIRQAANTRNWEKAELTARDLEDTANPHKPEARTRVMIADAIQCFRDDLDRCPHGHSYDKTAFHVLSCHPVAPYVIESTFESGFESCLRSQSFSVLTESLPPRTWNRSALDLCI